MLGKFILGAAASITAITALPATADAGHRDRYYGQRYNDGRYYNDGYYRYRRGDYYGGSYGRGYGRAGYGNNYGRGYGYNDRYYRGRRCGSGTTGAIVGGAAGALVGREIARDGGRYRYRRGGGNGTVGAIIGGAVGALVGREIDRSC